MAKKVGLRAVGPDEVVPAKQQKVSEAAASGDRLALLVSMRARVARTVEDPNTPPRDLAALTRRLLEIANEIEAIVSSSGDDEVGRAAATDDESWDESAI